MNNQRQVTVLLKDIKKGDTLAKERLLEILYQDIKRIAFNNGARGEHTMSPTVLAHDAYLRLMDKDTEFTDRFHFLSTISVVMRNLVIDYARNRNTRKRGGDLVKVQLQDHDKGDHTSNVYALNDALDVLRQIKPRQARLLELKYFGGLTLKEIARGLGVVPSTVHKDIKTAEAWLKLRLTRTRTESAS